MVVGIDEEVVTTVDVDEDVGMVDVMVYVCVNVKIYDDWDVSDYIGSHPSLLRGLAHLVCRRLASCRYQCRYRVGLYAKKRGPRAVLLLLAR